MTISQKTHNVITRLELHALIKACEECTCNFDCYCEGNRAWALVKLETLERDEEREAQRSLADLEQSRDAR